MIDLGRPKRLRNRAWLDSEADTPQVEMGQTTLILAASCQGHRTAPDCRVRPSQQSANDCSQNQDAPTLGAESGIPVDSTRLGDSVVGAKSRTDWRRPY